MQDVTGFTSGSIDQSETLGAFNEHQTLEDYIRCVRTIKD
jgi:hypothetical protein